MSTVNSNNVCCYSSLIILPVFKFQYQNNEFVSIFTITWHRTTEPWFEDSLNKFSFSSRIEHKFTTFINLDGLP